MLNTHQKAWLAGIVTVYLQCRKFDKAKPLLQLLIELYPTDTRPLKQLAYLHYQLSDFATALIFCDRCMAISDIQDARVHLLKSFCHLKSGDPNLARTSYNRFNELRNTS